LPVTPGTRPAPWMVDCQSRGGCCAASSCKGLGCGWGKGVGVWWG
jgi:hypothetical protein